MLEKTFEPAEVEKRQYARWESAGAFAADPRSGAQPYTIMMPPPNVTGSLHMGHALTFTLQDILIRYHRMRGFDTLWQPGTDHAGIATQAVVERQLAAKGIVLDRPGAARGAAANVKTIGREDFIAKVWEWKAESGGTITRQLRRLGASPDWPRERFTMDPGLSHAVRKVFVDLHKKGLIYRDQRLVNWDPKLHTAISDLEVQNPEVRGNLWHIRYPIKGEPDRYHRHRHDAAGDDAGRYRALPSILTIRATAISSARSIPLPLVGREIPIIADAYADPETGSGAVKITPAHDFNDFEVGRRHNLPRINIFDKSACVNENAPEAYRGLDRFEARKRIVADLEALGLVEKVEAHTHKVPHGDRGNVPFEPWLTDQWYVDAATLAAPAIRAVEQGDTKFVPEQWTKTYFEWMRNIQPWCISRQIWWGHQIPAWYGPDDKIFVEMSEAEAAAAAKQHYGKDVAAAPRRGRARYLVLLGALAVLHHRLAGADAGTEALLSRRCAGHRLRHHLLLGGADDDDGPAFHERCAVPHRLHPCPGARRARPEDVQVQGQCDRSPGPDRQIRLRCAALHPYRPGGAGPRHQALGDAGRGLSQLRDQALERRALCAR